MCASLLHRHGDHALGTRLLFLPVARNVLACMLHCVSQNISLYFKRQLCTRSRIVSRLKCVVLQEFSFTV